MTSDKREVCACGQETTHAYLVRIGIGRYDQAWLFTCAECLALERALFGEPKKVHSRAGGRRGDLWERLRIVLSEDALPVEELAVQLCTGERHVRRVLSEHREEVAVVAMVDRTKLWGLAASGVSA